LADSVMLGTGWFAAIAAQAGPERRSRSVRNKPGSTIVVLYRAVYPSTGSATPLTYDDAGLQSQRATAAIPSGADRIAGWPEAAGGASRAASAKARAESHD